MSFIKLQNVILDNADANTLEISGNLVPSSSDKFLGSSTNPWSKLSIGPWTIKSVGAGVLDTTFGNNGIIDTDFSMNYSISTTLVIDKKNNIIFMVDKVKPAGKKKISTPKRVVFFFCTLHP